MTLRDLDISERLYLICGWSPPTCEAERQVAPRWRTFEEMLGIYEEVRDAFLARHGRPGRVIFAETLYRMPGDDVEAAGRALMVRH